MVNEKIKINIYNNKEQIEGHNVRKEVELIYKQIIQFPLKLNL